MRRSIQDYLSLGYLYLLILGIIRDTVYYSFLDINIMSYTSILDVLLSPLVFLTTKVYIPAIIVAIGMATWFFSRYLKRRSSAQPSRSVKLSLSISENGFAVLMVAVMVFSMYFGAGLGQGQAVSKRIAEDRLKPTHRLQFVNDTSRLPVFLFGQNSQYLFFMTAGDSAVRIVPINGNIRQLTRLTPLRKD